MLLKQMRYFCAVVDARWLYTCCRRDLCFSICHLATGGELLKKELGVQLLNRKGRSFTLTAAG